MKCYILKQDTLDPSVLKKLFKNSSIAQKRFFFPDSNISTHMLRYIKKYNGHSHTTTIIMIFQQMHCWLCNKMCQIVSEHAFESHCPPNFTPPSPLPKHTLHSLLITLIQYPNCLQGPQHCWAVYEIQIIVSYNPCSQILAFSLYRCIF